MRRIPVTMIADLRLPIPEGFQPSAAGRAQRHQQPMEVKPRACGALAPAFFQ